MWRFPAMFSIGQWKLNLTIILCGISGGNCLLERKYLIWSTTLEVTYSNRKFMSWCRRGTNKAGVMMIDAGGGCTCRRQCAGIMWLWPCFSFHQIDTLWARQGSFLTQFIHICLQFIVLLQTNLILISFGANCKIVFAVLGIHLGGSQNQLSAPSFPLYVPWEFWDQFLQDIWWVVGV